MPPKLPRRLTRRELALPAKKLAPKLLGARLTRIMPDGTRLSGIIVETEAYVGIEDRASHAFAGRRTPRNESMYAKPGTAYVYFTYGMHFCFNVVCAQIDTPEAVLIRALEPIEGLDTMRRHRSETRQIPDLLLCSGPARLCQALRIDRTFDAIDLASDHQLYLSDSPIPEPSIDSGPRIGIGDKGSWTDARLRFWIRGNQHVSRQKTQTHP